MGVQEPLYVTRPMLPDRRELADQIDEIWESQWLTNGGSKHQQLEAALTTTLGVPALSLFNNGTIALLVAIQCLGLSGEVITTPFTFPATTHVLPWNRLTPVFCDIDDETLTLDPARLEASISSKTTGILGVHVYGMPCSVTAIQQLADRHGLRVIYDGAHAFGTEIGGVGIGNFGDITMFSFHATKLFHTLEGGALAFRDAALKERVDLLKNFGIKNEEEVLLPGVNGKMNELQAAVGLINLRHLEAERARRMRIVERYKQQLGGVAGIRIFEIPAGIRNSLQYFMIRIGPEFGLDRDAVHQELKKYNIITRKYFYPLCSNYEFYRNLPSAQPENLPVANKAAKEVLCLPLYGKLELSDVDRVCDTLKRLQRAQ